MDGNFESNFVFVDYVEARSVHLEAPASEYSTFVMMRLRVVFFCGKTYDGPQERGRALQEVLELNGSFEGCIAGVVDVNGFWRDA